MCMCQQVSVARRAHAVRYLRQEQELLEREIAGVVAGSRPNRQVQVAASAPDLSGIFRMARLEVVQADREDMLRHVLCVVLQAVGCIAQWKEGLECQ